MNLKSPIKWVGGKYQLRNIIEKQILPLTFIKYIEPFAGGLSIFFHLVNIEKINKNTIVILNDLNEILIRFYLDIKDNCELLIKKVKKICESDKDYYHYRKKFNELVGVEDHSPSKNDCLSKSALFLYLNKSCFNGLYRVNKRGEFNASWNKKKYKIPKCEITNIRNISKIFNEFNITFSFESYENIIASECENKNECEKENKNECEKVNINNSKNNINTNDIKDNLNNTNIPNTLIYMDPPYYPIKKLSFLYNKGDFDFDKFFENMNYIYNSYIICSNSSCQTVEDKCEKLVIDKINSLRKINSNGKDRKCKELLIMNYVLV